MNKTKITVLFSFFAACSLCFVTFAGGQQQSSGPQTSEVIEGFSFKVIDTSEQRSIVTGAQATMLPNGSMKMLEVSSYLYQNDRLEIQLHTPEAIANTQTGIVDSEFPVIITNAEGMRVEGVGMHWDTGNKKLTLLHRVNSIFKVNKKIINVKPGKEGSENEES